MNISPVSPYNFTSTRPQHSASSALQADGAHTVEEQMALILKTFGCESSGDIFIDLNNLATVANTDAATELKNKRALLRDIDAITAELKEKGDYGCDV